MGTFYGGLAHVPIASLVMVCELAGSYDLLVPLMFAEGIAFVALRDRALYHAQVATKRESPAHRDDFVNDVLRNVTVGQVMMKDRQYVAFEPKTPAVEVMRSVASSDWQDAFPVLDAEAKLVGVVYAEILRTMTTSPDLGAFALAADLMVPPGALKESDDLHSALEQILVQGVRELLVTNEAGQIVGFLDEAEITRAYHGAIAGAVDR
jgi:CIC family chloride channel protein